MTSLRDELMKRLVEEDDGFFKQGMQIVSGFPFRRKVELVKYCGIPISFKKYPTPDNGCATRETKAVSRALESTVDKGTRTRNVVVGSSGAAISTPGVHTSTPGVHTSTPGVHTSDYDEADNAGSSIDTSIVSVKGICGAYGRNVNLQKEAIHALTNTFIPIETNHILNEESFSSYTCMDGESKNIAIHTETTKRVPGSAVPIHKAVTDVSEFLQMVERCSPISDASGPGSIANDNNSGNIDFINDIDADVPDLLDWQHGMHEYDQEYTRIGNGEHDATCLSQTEDTFIATRLSKDVEFVDSGFTPVVATHFNQHKSATETFNTNVNENNIDNLIIFSVPEQPGIFRSQDRCGTLLNEKPKHKTGNEIFDLPLDSVQQTMPFNPVIEIVSSISEENEHSFNIEEQDVSETLVHMDMCPTKHLSTEHNVSTKSRPDVKLLNIEHEMKAKDINNPNRMMRSITPSSVKVQSDNIRCSNTYNQRTVISQNRSKHYPNVLKTVKPNPMYLTNEPMNYNNLKNKTLFVHSRNESKCQKIGTKKKQVQKQLAKLVTSECNESNEINVSDKQNSCKQDTDLPSDDINCSNSCTCIKNKMDIQLKKRKRTEQYISFCAKKLKMKNRETIHKEKHLKPVKLKALVDTSTCQSRLKDNECVDRNTLTRTQKYTGVFIGNKNVNTLERANRSTLHDAKTAHNGLVMKPVLSKTRDKPHNPEINDFTSACSKKGLKLFTQKAERSVLKVNTDVRIRKNNAKINEVWMHKVNIGKMEITKDKHNDLKTYKDMKTGIAKHNSPLKKQKANTSNKMHERTKRVNKEEATLVRRITATETSGATTKITTSVLKNNSNSSHDIAKAKAHAIHGYNSFVRERQVVLDAQEEARNTPKIQSNVVDYQMGTKIPDVTTTTKRSPNKLHESLQYEDSKLSYLPKFCPSYICDICNDLYFTTPERLDFHYRVSHSASQSLRVSEHGDLVKYVTSTQLERKNTSGYNWTELGDPDSVRNMLSTLIGESDKQKRNLFESEKDVIDKEDVSRPRNHDDLITGQKCPPLSDMQSQSEKENSTNKLQWENKVERITPVNTINKSMIEISELKSDSTLNSPREERIVSANNAVLENGKRVANTSGKSISKKSKIVSEIQKTKIHDENSNENLNLCEALHIEKPTITKESLKHKQVTICEQTSVKRITENETIIQTNEFTNSDGKQILHSGMQSEGEHNKLQQKKQVERITPEKATSKSMVKISEFRFDSTLNSSREESINSANTTAINNVEKCVSNCSGQAISKKSTIVSEIQKIKIHDLKSSEKLNLGEELHFGKPTITKECLKNKPVTICDEISVKLITENETIRQTKEFTYSDGKQILHLDMQSEGEHNKSNNELQREKQVERITPLISINKSFDEISELRSDTNSHGKNTGDQLDTVIFATRELGDGKPDELNDKPVLNVAKRLLLLSSVDSDSDANSMRVRADSCSSVDSLASALECVTGNTTTDTTKRQKPNKEYGRYPYDDTRSGYRERLPQTSEDTRDFYGRNNTLDDIIRRPSDSFKDRNERSEFHVWDSVHVSTKNSRDHVENIKRRHDSNSCKSSDFTRERERLRYESGSSKGSHRSYDDDVAWDTHYIIQDNFTQNKHHTSPNRFERRNDDRKLTPKRPRSISRDRSREIDLREKIRRVKDTKYEARRESRYRGLSPHSLDTHRRNKYNEEYTSERHGGEKRRRSRSNDSRSKSRDRSSKDSDSRHGHGYGYFKEDSANKYRHSVRKTIESASSTRKFSFSKHDRSFISRHGRNCRSSSRRPDNPKKSRNHVKSTESGDRSSKCKPLTSKTAADAQDNEKSISKVSVEEQLNKIPVNEQTNEVTMNKHSSQVFSKDQATQVTVNVQISPVTVNEQTHPVTVNEQTNPVTVNEQTNPVTVNKQTNSVSVNEQKSSVTVNEQTNPVTVNEQTHPVTVNEQTNTVTLNEQTNPVTVNEQTNPVSVNEQKSSVTVNEQTNPVTANVQTSSVTVNEQTRPVTMNKQLSPICLIEQTTRITRTEETSEVTKNKKTSQVTLKEQTSPVTVNEQTSPVPGTEQASHVAVNEKTSPVTGTEQTSPVTVNEQTHLVTGNEQTHHGTGNEQTNPVTVNEQKSPVNVNEQTSSVTVIEQTSPVTGTEKTCPVSESDLTSKISLKENAGQIIVNEQTSTVTGTEQTSPVTGTEQTNPVTVNEQTSSVSVTEQSRSVITNEQTSPVTVNKLTSSVTVIEHTSPATVNKQTCQENINKNDTYEVKMKSHETIDTDTSMELQVETSGTLRVLCQKCGSEFESVDKLHRHMYNEHLAVFKCNKCRLGFATPNEHACHMSKQHTRKNRERRKSNQRDQPKTIHTRERKMSGNSDKQKIRHSRERRISSERDKRNKRHNEHALTRDMDTGYKMSSCGYKRDADKTEVKKDVSGEKYEKEEGELVDYKTFCRICKEDFQTREKLADHLWKQHGKRIFSTVDRKMASPPFKKYRNTPGNDRTLTCQVCHLRCKTKDHLFKHLELTSHFIPKSFPQKHLTLKGLQHL